MFPTVPTQHHSQDPARRSARRRTAAAAVAAASAHVRVFPDTTEAGAYAVLTFRVPTESDTASTTRVEVTLPTDHPFTYAAVQPVAGWTAEVTEAALPAPVEVDGTTITRAPRTLTWTAQEGAGTAPGQFERFAVLAGPLPAAGTTVELPAVQTYSDGSEVAWDQPVPASGEEPEEPAPALVTTSAAAADADASQASAVDGSAGGGSGPALWLGLTGAVLGAAALVVSLLRRRPTTVS